jgi:predicted amidohydrolase
MSICKSKSALFICIFSAAACGGGESSISDPVGAADGGAVELDGAPQTPAVDGSTPPVTPPAPDAYVPPVQTDSAVVPPPVDSAPPPVADASVDALSPDATIDAWVPPLPPSTDNKVAAVQYGTGQAGQVDPSCLGATYPDVCAVKALTVEARNAGAYIIVLPENYSIAAKYVEPIPKVGDRPAGWNMSADAQLKTFSQLADDLDIILVLNLQTYAGTQSNPQYYNTSVAFDATGSVLAVHHKFNLFGGENGALTAGGDVAVFDTPIGKMGLLICADIYGSTSLNSKLANTLKARVVAVSSFWTVSNANSWYKTYAKSYGVYAIAANTTNSPGIGGGIYDTKGVAVAEKVQTSPVIVYATIPKP